MSERDKQINAMIEATMELARSADRLQLKTVPYLYRMILLELTNAVGGAPDVGVTFKATKGIETTGQRKSG